MTVTLTAAVGFADTPIPVSADIVSEYFLIDSEAFRVRAHASAQLLVDRGVLGTSPAAHSNGATLTPVYLAITTAPGTEAEPAATFAALTVTGATTLSGDATVTKTITSATPATERLIRSEITLTPATAATIGTGSIAGVRGLVTVSSGKSITPAGFLYGTQGKVILDGATIDVGSSHVAGVYAQMSAAGATFTSGHIAPLISCGQSLPAGIADMIYCENNDVTVLNAIIEAIANANFVISATSEDGNSAYLATTAGSSASKYMRVKLSGTEYRIALLAAS